MTRLSGIAVTLLMVQLGWLGAPAAAQSPHLWSVEVREHDFVRVNNRNQLLFIGLRGNPSRLWDPATGVLHVLPLRAWTLNDRGEVVGAIENGDSSVPALWSIATRLIVLSDVAGEFVNPWAINNSGEIGFTRYDPDGRRLRTFIFNRSTGAATDLPLDCCTDVVRSPRGALGRDQFVNRSSSTAARFTCTGNSRRSAVSSTV